MKHPCSYSNCGGRRIHHEMPDEPRGTQMVEVPDDHPIDKPAYCSITCAVSAGAMSLKAEPTSPEELERLKKTRFWKD